MLSYRHAFHAGNHADVLKHLLLIEALDHLVAKADRPLCFIDTHAGPGLTALDSPEAARLREHAEGIGRLAGAAGLDGALARYVHVVSDFDPPGTERGSPARYPGSPAIAARLLRPDDRLVLHELHPADFDTVAGLMAGDRRARVLREDGFARLPGLLPPRERRALVLIDPPYEVKQDYRRVGDALKAALRRFATGCYLTWYPLLGGRDDAQRMVATLEGLAPKWLSVELEVRRAAERGMHGSGVCVINPPWRLRERLEAAGPELARRLAQDEAARFRLRAAPAL